MRRVIIGFLLGVLISLLVMHDIIVQAYVVRDAFADNPAFANAPYARDPQFRAEELRTLDHVYMSGYWLATDFEGQYFTVQHGFRVVQHRPATYARTVWLLGSSTMFDQGLPDGLTVADQLQRLTMDRVFNAACVGCAIVNQYALLLDLPTRAGDLVVFYDGVGDSWYYDGSSWTDTMLHYLAMAKAYAAQHGLRFIEIAEPNLFSYPPTPDEVHGLDLLAAGRALRIERDTAIVYAQLAKAGAVDMSHCLDGYRAAGHVVFIDLGHIGDPQAAVLVAKCMEDIINRFNDPALSVNKGTGTPFPAFTFNAGLLNIKGGAS